MAKRDPNLFTWQWRGYAANHRDRTNLALHLVAVPLFIVSLVVLLIGVFGLAPGTLLLGVIGMAASLAIQRNGHRLEAQAPEPFSDRPDALKRLLAEQLVTFPRFLFSGAWWRAWREARRRR
ncbi:MAG: hypothetical protein GAK43_01256 [Stenotrophomonas maltophilia]|nr:MAG: hypothetical protein GAK43_01256 [Stenotrophomonas maltophilia]